MRSWRWLTIRSPAARSPSHIRATAVRLLLHSRKRMPLGRHLWRLNNGRGGAHLGLAGSTSDHRRRPGSLHEDPAEKLETSGQGSQRVARQTDTPTDAAGTPEDIAGALGLQLGPPRKR